jgi:hypothetical protein
MNRYQAFGGRHFRPIADPADMAGIAQSHGRKAGSLAFFDPDPHRLWRNRLPVTKLAVDHRKRRRIDHDLRGLVRNDGAHFLPADVDRNANDPVTVMSGEIGGRQICRNAQRFLG